MQESNVISSNPVTICFPARKGGVGKTTLTANIAACYANDGKRVLVVGADNQEDLSNIWCVNSPDAYDPMNHRSLADVLHGTCRPEEAVYRTAEHPAFEYRETPFFRHSTRRRIQGKTYHFDIMPAGRDIFEVSVPDGGLNLLKDRLAPLMAGYDVVLFDIPTAPYDSTMLIYACTRYAFVPVTDVASFGSASQTTDEVAYIRSLGYPMQIMGFIMNCADSRDGSLGQSLEEMFRSQAGVPVLSHTLRQSMLIRNAACYGIPLISYDTWGPQSADMYNLYKEIRGMIGKEES